MEIIVKMEYWQHFLLQPQYIPLLYFFTSSIMMRLICWLKFTQLFEVSFHLDGYDVQHQ